MHRLRTLQLFLVLVIAALALTSASLLLSRPQQALCERCSVIVISLDSLGAGALSSMPELATIARAHGVSFTHAYAQAPWSVPSHAALLTGVYPWDLPIWDGVDPLAERALTLAERLNASGYRTRLFSDGFVQKEFGFGQGFDAVDGSLEGSRPAGSVFAAAKSWILASSSQPYLAVIHPQEVALPYREVDAGALARMHAKAGGLTSEDLALIQGSYLAEAQDAGRAVAAFLEELEADGSLERTIIVITAGNGELIDSAADAGLHAGSLRTSALHVPLLFFVPGVDAAEVAASVETRSVPATLLELIGVAYEERSLGGSLASYLTGAESGDRVVIAKNAKTLESALAGLELTRGVVAAIRSGEQLPLERSADVPHDSVAIRGEIKVYAGRDGSQQVIDLQKDPLEQSDASSGLSVEARGRMIELLLELAAH